MLYPEVKVIDKNGKTQRIPQTARNQKSKVFTMVMGHCNKLMNREESVEGYVEAENNIDVIALFCIIKNITFDRIKVISLVTIFVLSQFGTFFLSLLSSFPSLVFCCCLCNQLNDLVSREHNFVEITSD